MQKSALILFVITFPVILHAQWLQTNLNPGAAYCLFSNDTSLFAGTETGTYFTHESGDPWFSIGPEDLIFSVITSGANLVAGSGTGKGVWISSDLGENWDLASGIDQQSVNALCKNENYLFAGAWAGGVFRSDDHGASWQKVGLDGEAVKTVFCAGDTIFSGGIGRIYFSTNNGDQWEYRSLPWPVSYAYSFICKDGKIFAGTDAGLYSSNDAGDSWVLEYGATYDSSGNIIDAKMFRYLAACDQYLIAAINFNSIWISSDMGKTWSAFNEGLISDWSFCGLAFKDDYFWALREVPGNAYRRPLADLLTTLSAEAVTLPGDDRLYRNYPNPFNPSTKIKYQVHRKGFVTLKVYNILGNEIATLVMQEKQSGTYEATFNADQLASGVYFYSIQIGHEFFETKRMLLLR